MKIKIFFSILLLIISINIVTCDETGTLTYSGSDTLNHPGIIAGTTGTSPYTFLGINDVSYHEGLNFISYKILDSYWQGSLENSEWMQTTYSIAGTPIGTGNVGFNRHSGFRMVYFLFTDIDFSGYSGGQGISLSQSPVMGSIFSTGMNDYHTDRIQMFIDGSKTVRHAQCIIKHDYEYNYPYIFKDKTNLLNFELDRTPSYPSLHVKLSNQYEEIYNESTFYNTDIDFNSPDINNKSWIVTLELYTNNEVKYLYHSFPPAVIESDCRIEVDDIKIGNIINVSYYNIDDLRLNPIKYGNSDYATCNINIQVIADRGYYEELIYQDLITDELDNTFFYSSDTLTNGIYYTQINKELGSLTEYAVRKTFIISEPSNYSISVYPSSVYIGDNINIIYKSLNESTISVYDNNSNLIKSWINIQGDNQKVYQIPIDEIYDNNYPDWFIYLNDSGNTSNTLRYNFSVNWKVYVPIDPTPKPTEPYYNVTIEENIEEIKQGLNPFKQLIFGLSTIFVDNPDYNNDNIIDVDEISVWLNSLISIAIVIFLFILYKVYKRK